MRALEIVDVHDLGLVEDREVDALVDLLAQVEEIGPRLVGDVHAPAHQRAEPEQRDAELILAVLAVLLEHPLGDQRDREPMHRALGEPEPPRQRADADLDLVLGECLEQADRGRDRGQPPAPPRISVLPAAFVLAMEMMPVPLCGPMFQASRRSVADVSITGLTAGGWRAESTERRRQGA